ncbi:hypothetical protein Avbf_14986 [Armadillidium vulgare]|nr:hypothetical protein Avbf_14986 [Armadillidium vulgare]
MVFVPTIIWAIDKYHLNSTISPQPCFTFRCVTIYRFQRKLRPKRLFSPIKTLSYMVFLWIFAMAAQTLTLTESKHRSKLFLPSYTASIDEIVPPYDVPKIHLQIRPLVSSIGAL